MLAKECMTGKVDLIGPNATIREAAAMMEKSDIGFLPVSEKNRLIGVITDRDIALRGVGTGEDPNSTTVRSLMSKGVLFCYDDQPIEEVAKNMAEVQVRRLPVLSREKNLVGVLSLCDIARAGNEEAAEVALRGIVRNEHNETRARRHAQEREAV